MMKRILATILTLCLLSVVAAVHAGESIDITWYFNSGDGAAEQYAGTTLVMTSEDGVTGSIEVSRNGQPAGTWSFTLADPEENLYEVTGNQAGEEHIANFTLDTKAMRLTLNDNGTTSVFALSPTVDLGTGVEITAPSGADGRWTITTVVTGDVAIPADNDQMVMMLDRFFGSHDTAVTLRGGMLTMLGTDYACVLKDGALIYETENPEMNDITVTLRDNGAMLITRMGLTFVCVR